MMTDRVPKSLKDIMMSLATLNRTENNREIQDRALIDEAADSLSQGSDEIVELLTRKPYSKATLASIFKQYKLRYYLDVVDSIDIEFHDDSQMVLSTIGTYNVHGNMHTVLRCTSYNFYTLYEKVIFCAVTLFES